jgi:hypothetical protein
MRFVRDTVADFFDCADCKANFLESYRSGANNRPAEDSVDRDSLALWLWRVHNSVTARVARKDIKEVAWPPDCEDCSNEAVLQALNMTYWNQNWLVSQTPVAGTIAANTNAADTI